MLFLAAVVEQVKKIAMRRKKTAITYARTYRSLSVSPTRFVVCFLLSALPISLCMLFFYPQISNLVCKFVAALISDSFDPEFFFVLKSPIFKFDNFIAEDLSIMTGRLIDPVGMVSFLSVPGKFPSELFNWINLLVTMILLFLLTFFIKVRPITVFSYILLIVHLSACLFFVFIPEEFPYTAAEYSGLYMRQEILMFIFIPLLLGACLCLIPLNAFKIFLTIVGTFIYSFSFGVIRYAVFLYILGKVSMLYMALLFFILGPFVDFLYVVAIYSLAINKASIALDRTKEIWKW